MPVRFMRNRKTGVVFAWNNAFKRHPDIEEISAEEAAATLKHAMERREAADRVRAAIASPKDAFEHFQKVVAEGDDLPVPPPAEEPAPKAKKPKKSS